MIRNFSLAQTKVSRFAWRPLHRKMCSADGGSAATARFMSAATKGSNQLKAFLVISSFSGGVYYLSHSQDWRRKIEGKIEEHSEPVQRILNSQVRSYSTDDYIPRTDLSDKLKAGLLSTEVGVKDFFISITGNLEVGKSRLVRNVLKGRSGVLEVYLGNHETPEKALCSVLGVADMAAVERAFAAAERQLGHKPVIVLDLHERVTDPKIIDAVSHFTQVFGCEQKLAKVILVCCAAATAAEIGGRDCRKIGIFVPEFTREDLDSADARRAFGIWHGEPVQDSDVDRIFDLVGGRIGNIQDILVFGRKGGLMGSLDKALASMERRISHHVRQFGSIDISGGFGRGKVRLASWLAHEVARVPFEQCLPRDRLPLRPKDFGETARDRHADAIYFNPEVMGYCARSPFVHRQLASIPFLPESLRKPPS